MEARVLIFFTTSVLSKDFIFFRSWGGVLVEMMMFLAINVAALSTILTKEGRIKLIEFDTIIAVAHEVCRAFEMAKSNITLS